MGDLYTSLMEFKMEGNTMAKGNDCNSAKCVSLRQYKKKYTTTHRSITAQT